MMEKADNVWKKFPFLLKIVIFAMSFSIFVLTANRLLDMIGIAH